MKFIDKLKGMLPGGRKGDDDNTDDIDDTDDTDDTNDTGEDDLLTKLSTRLGGRRNLIIAAAGAAVVVLGLVGGMVWMLTGSSGGKPVVATGADNAGPRVVVDIPPMRKAGSVKQRRAGSLNAIAAADQGPGAGVLLSPFTAASFSGLKQVAAGKPLLKAPAKGLVEQGKQGPLPKIGDNGSKPWQVYARPFNGNNTLPEVAIIVTGMGLSRAATEAAIKRLPGEVTLAFDPYGEGLKGWVAAARAAGHEVLISLPAEPNNFPVFDPGPDALMTTLKPEENQRRLRLVLSRFTGYVGVITTMGSKFFTADRYTRPILETLKARGLMFIDGGSDPKTLAPKIATEIGLPRVMNNLLLVGSPSKANIDRMLSELEPIARNQSVVAVVTDADPANLERIVAWISTLAAKKMVLAPVSAIANKQFIE